VSPGGIIINQQVLQLRQNIVALGHVIFSNIFTAARGCFLLNGFLKHDSTRLGSKWLKYKRAKTKAPSHNETQ
jgi:hypothetical protein